MKKKTNLFDWIIIILISFFCLTILYPVWNQIVLSFSSASEMRTLQISMWPEKWSLEAYKFIFGFGNIGRAYFNTILRTIVGTLMIVSVTVLAAYPLSRKDLPFRGFFMTIFVIAMFVSGGMIPSYLLVKNLGLLNSVWALVLPNALNVTYVIIVRNFFLSISPSIEESAIMDGASPFQILLKIILPLSKPIIVTIALWAAVYHWNEWFMAQIYIQDQNLDVLQTVVRKMLMNVDASRMDTQIASTGANASELLLANVRAATVVVSIGPIVLLYPFAQKYFIQGLQLGAVKG
ncbi:carbohydrate ABC transporter permease [Globicatella sanguinis]|uniref:carbohydrate ABC transporter permease n=1 Tax=Globicatella sanguinis TaxID=13076 RepID=UPI0008261FDC|nr:carbohydrate ABC transporter permease [Globicatella sanguinis]MDK7630500.1 carbohydrate ABC transporter permease [Globicatella sanguinis]WIK66238.1 carbohydrate ABC transporter permease [Globicatella sanguinis]WKT55643.1 carbohydrate ABC transporter permease [Globicatella sanguinis]